VLLALLGRVPAREEVSVEGWRAAALPERVYPGLVPAADAIVHGLLLTGLTAAERLVLDDFEWPMYELRRLRLADGRHGMAYVWGRREIRASDEDWSPADFEARHLAAFVERCAAWRGRP
jgi:gamma-glutamylcyclotransferase (GGCT)/AIG2-like uncharacterized protein YtfP